MIVVATNGAAESTAALDWAVAEAVRRASPLRVVVAVPVPATLGGALADPTALPDEVVDAARGIALAARDVARASGVEQVETSVQIGTPAAVLVAESEAADLVVLGTRGRGEIASALLGSVSVAVSAHARCPVVVVRPGTHARLDAGHGVLVGVEDSRHSRHTVGFAADVASRAGVTLTLLAAWTMPSVGLAGLDYAPFVDPQTAQAIAAATAQTVESARQQILAVHPSLPVVPLVVQGEPGLELARHGEDAGLLVVGSRGHGGFTGLLLGSVSHYVLHEAPCAVAVVR